MLDVVGAGAILGILRRTTICSGVLFVPICVVTLVLAAKSMFVLMLLSMALGLLCLAVMFAAFWLYESSSFTNWHYAFPLIVGVYCGATAALYLF